MGDVNNNKQRKDYRCKPQGFNDIDRARMRVTGSSIVSHNRDILYTILRIKYTITAQVNFENYIPNQ